MMLVSVPEIELKTSREYFSRQHVKTLSVLQNMDILKHFLQYRRCFYYLYNANKNKRIMDSGRFKKALGNYPIKAGGSARQSFLMDELVLILFCLH